MNVDYDDVVRARERLRPFLPATPVRACHSHARRAFLKLECWQPTGSFKVRGATNLLASLSSEERSVGIVAASAGNHALGVAFAVQALGGATPATLFVPKSAPRAKLDKLRRFPVDLRIVGQTYDEAHHAAAQHAAQTRQLYVHAFDDPRTVAGQGTVMLELLDQLPDVASIVVPVGGGGLIAGIAAVLAHHPQVQLVAVQPAASPALRDSLRVGRPLFDYSAEATLADGLAGGIGALVWQARERIDHVVTVSEQALEQAVVRLLEGDQVLVEGSAAVALAALDAPELESLPEPIALVLTGANLDLAVLRQLLARHG